MQQSVTAPEERRETEETRTSSLPSSSLLSAHNLQAAIAPAIRPDLLAILNRNYGPPFTTHSAAPPTISVSPVFEQSAGVHSSSSATRSSRSASLFSRQQSSSSTLPTPVETEGSEQNGHTKDRIQDTPPSVPSSVNATDGSDSATSVSTADEIDHIWGQGDVANQFNVFIPRDHPRRRRARREQVVVVHQNEDGECMDFTSLMKTPNQFAAPINTTFEHRGPGVSPLSNKQLAALTVLAFLAFTNLFFTTYVCIVLTQGAITLRRANCVMRLSTYISALCTATAMGVVRRPLYEILGGFVAVLLVGNGIRTELLEWLL
jgi:hypothetical protein